MRKSKLISWGFFSRSCIFYDILILCVFLRLQFLYLGTSIISSFYLPFWVLWKQKDPKKKLCDFFIQIHNQGDKARFSIKFYYDFTNIILAWRIHGTYCNTRLCVFYCRLENDLVQNYAAVVEVDHVKR